MASNNEVKEAEQGNCGKGHVQELSKCSLFAHRIDGCRGREDISDEPTASRLYDYHDVKIRENRAKGIWGFKPENFSES